jgi:hypothetical protein
MAAACFTVVNKRIVDTESIDLLALMAGRAIVIRFARKCRKRGGRYVKSFNGTCRIICYNYSEQLAKILLGLLYI